MRAFASLAVVASVGLARHVLNSRKVSFRLQLQVGCGLAVVAAGARLDSELAELTCWMFPLAAEEAAVGRSTASSGPGTKAQGRGASGGVQAAEAASNSDLAAAAAPVPAGSPLCSAAPPAPHPAAMALAAAAVLGSAVAFSDSSSLSRQPSSRTATAPQHPQQHQQRPQQPSRSTGSGWQTSPACPACS